MLSFLKKLLGAKSAQDAAPQPSANPAASEAAASDGPGGEDGSSRRHRRGSRRHRRAEQSAAETPATQQTPAAESRPSSSTPPAAEKRPAREPRGPRPPRERGERRPRPDAANRERRPRTEERDASPAAPIPAPPAPEPEGAWDPASFDIPPEEGQTRFQDFALPTPILHGIADLGFRYCTPIQAQALGLAMAGKNVAGKAQTGTGKTAAFLITIFRRMLENPASRPTRPGRPAALILGPTRELVIQIAKDAADIGKYTGIRCVAVYGGMDYARQEDEVKGAPVDIIAATPGRLLDFRRSRIVDLSGVHTLVIDEADRMLDMGFIPDVSRIVRELPRENERQTMLFSATLNDDIMRLAARWMPDPVQVSVETESVAAETIRQIVYPIRSEDKFKVLYNFLRRENAPRVLVFCNRKVECERLHAQLLDYGIAAEVLSGDVAQNKRLRVLEDFRAGKLPVVVATDVAGRGIHVDDISYVVNYDFPYEADDYVHRIGRTGRAGHEGTAISFACEDESFIIPDIEKLLGEELPCEMPDEELMAELPEVEHRHSAALRGARRGGGRPGGGFHRGGPRRGPPRRR